MKVGIFEYEGIPLVIGELNGSIQYITFNEEKIQETYKGTIELEETLLMQQLMQEIKEYFSGEIDAFTVPIVFPFGTVFQQQVWRALQAIPFGKTASYKDIAEAVGNPKAYRGVGMANNKNPLAIVVP